MKHNDILLDCLVELTRLYGRPMTHSALVAGLPIDKDGLKPSTFSRAASRAGFATKIVKMTLEELNEIADSIYSYNAKGCLDNNLVDGLVYEDQLDSIIRKNMTLEIEDQLHTISFKDYLKKKFSILNKIKIGNLKETNPV